MAELFAFGSLQVQVNQNESFIPITDASVTLTRSDNPDDVLSLGITDENGQVFFSDLAAPSPENDENPGEPLPYALYNLQIEKDGYQTLTIDNIEIFPNSIAIQPVALQVLTPQTESTYVIVIPPNTLNGDDPPKMDEAEIKPINESGEIVLSRVVIPEYIIVHDGAPSNRNAPNYYVRYKDYIKNVASSELYATWPDATLRANILAIQSFTLNRVYTEWYRNKGYNFTITSNTAYDQKWSYGRTIYKSISTIVDEMFANYLSRPNIKQPILTQYCDGKNVTCNNWLSQWGSKYLGDRGYSAIEILRNYYGNSIYINSATEISGIPSSWPGYNLTLGSTGSKVRQMQEQLTAIHRSYPAILSTTPDGIFGPRTKASVQSFQSVFGLPASGIVDYPTWYKISEIYVGVSRIAELN